MKKIGFLSIICFLAVAVNAQEFTKQLNTARTAYAANKLDDSRFAMQQMLQELDMITGKELLKLLPAKLEEQNAVTTKDNVAGASNFLGITIHREYGAANKQIDLEIITHSPLIASVNAILSLPFIAGSADYKVIKIEGYKALVQKSTGENDRTDYELQLPLNNSMITLKAPGYSQDQIIKMANALPIAEIAKMVQ